MASAYLGYFVVEDVQVAYEIFVAGEDKEEAYQTYCEYFRNEASQFIQAGNLTMLPIEKFHYNCELENLDGSLIDCLIMTSYPKVHFEGHSIDDEDKFSEIMADDYLDYHPSNVDEEE